MPNEVWIVGKGPGLERYNFLRKAGFTFALNQTAYVLPWADVAITRDSLIYDNYIEVPLDPDITIITTKEVSVDRPSPNDIYYQDDSKFDGRCGKSSHFAFWTAAELGARKIHLVGFDSLYGRHEYSKICDPYMTEVLIKGRDYAHSRPNRERKLNTLVAENREAINDVKKKYGTEFIVEEVF